MNTDETKNNVPENEQQDDDQMQESIKSLMIFFPSSAVMK